MRIKCKTVMEGPGPSEKIVAIPVRGGGEEEVILPKDLVKDETNEVGEVRRSNGSILIELPQETASGSWRLWVDAEAETKAA
jgi:hypothetical protein